MEKNRKETALKLFNEKYNCAQSILIAYSDLVNIDKKMALKIASGFGGGIARLGKTCGTINAAVMLLSLKYGEEEKEDIESKTKTREIVRNFILDFGKIHKSINCADLLTEEKDKTYVMHSEKCTSIVEEVCDLLDKYMFFEIEEK